jgi:hypothetical protein
LIAIPAGLSRTWSGGARPGAAAIAICDWRGVGETTDLMALHFRRVFVRAPE